MLAFWLGSVPLLVGLVVGTRLLSGRVARLVPYAAALLMVVAGTYTASGRGFASLSHELKVSSILLDQLNDGSSAEELDKATIEAGIEQLVATPLPCCQNRKAAAGAGDAEPTNSGSTGEEEEQ